MSGAIIGGDSSTTVAVRPYCTYLMCSAPRTGSTLLATALEATGLAGRPAEYFDIHQRNEEIWRARLDITDDTEYLDRVVRRATMPATAYVA